MTRILHCVHVPASIFGTNMIDLFNEFTFRVMLHTFLYPFIGLFFIYLHVEHLQYRNIELISLNNQVIIITMRIILPCAL